MSLKKAHYVRCGRKQRFRSAAAAEAIAEKMSRKGRATDDLLPVLRLWEVARRACGFVAANRSPSHDGGFLRKLRRAYQRSAMGRSQGFASEHLDMLIGLHKAPRKAPQA